MSRLLVLAALVWIAPYSLLAQAQSALDERILSLEKQLSAAFEKGQQAAFEKLVAKEALVITPRGSVIDRAQWIGALEQSRGTSDDHKVQVIGDTAIATHRSTVKGYHYRTTHVWANRGGTWQLVSAQSTAIAEVGAAGEPAGIAAPCQESSFEPEVTQFYGDSSAVLGKLASRDLGLDRRRMYVLLIETEGSAELVLFDRSKSVPGMVNVMRWSGLSAGSLRETLTRVMLENQGIACIGEQSKMIINAAFTPADQGGIPVPVSSSGAFGPFIEKYGTKYIRVSAFLLC